LIKGTKMATDFPSQGDDFKITLRNSEYPQFDRDFAENIEEFNPEIWSAGGNIRGNEAYVLWGQARDGSEDPEVLDWIKEREAWAARHFDNGSQFQSGDLEPNMSNVGGVVSQMKWGVIGALGEQGMKDVILELVKKQEGKKEDRQLSDAVEEGLINKRDEHNDEVGDDDLRRASLPMLREVFERGVGAYETNPASVRPGVSGPEQWAYARVNSFLFALKNDRFQGGDHDTDLFPSGHPLASEDRKYSEEDRPYPNEHAARINDPSKYDEFRREADAGGDGIDFIYGIFVENDERVSEIQSVRFDSSMYTMEQSIQWLADNDMEPIKFEESSGERAERDEHLPCPPATQDVELNTENRDRAIEMFNYGPLNVDEPGDYWEGVAEYWNTTVEAARSSKCANCVAFDISQRMKDCLPGETSDEDGELGYCWMHHFKCHSERSCHTWAAGGPIDSDETSFDWQANAFGVEVEPEESEDDRAKDASQKTQSRHIVEITEDEDSILIKFGKGMDFDGINVMPEEVKDDEEDEMTESVEVERFSKTETLHRAEVMEPETVDDRRVRMSVSSEMPVERGYGSEVLDHNRASVNMDFMNSGRAPLLMDHDPERQIGVVESVSLDEQARRLRAVVRFSRNALASEVYDDVTDGIRGNVSIGYRVTKMARDENSMDVFRATSWEPLEISIVSIPADQSVGVGRSHEISPETENLVPTVEITEMGHSNETVRQDSVSAYQKEVSEIIDLGVRHNQRAVAEDAIRQGMGLAQFRGVLLEKVSDKPLDAPEIDMNQKEQRSYSLMNAIRSAALGRLDGFEAEVSQELSRHYGKEARGFYVPTSIFKRDILTTSPANGSNLVPEDHLAGEFIDALRSNLVISGLGARMMQGLKGDVAIPALNSKTTVGFVSENAAPGSEGAPDFRQVTMSPKELRQYVDISRKLMMQSDPSVEQIIRDDMTRQFAAKIDEVAINGGGSGEPTGILQTNGIGSVALGTNGGAISYASLVELEREVAIDNALAGNLAYLTNPRVVGSMRQTPRQDSGVEGNFILNDSNTVLGYDVASTTLVPSGLTKGTSDDCSAVIFGNYSDLMIGMFGGLDVLVDPYSGSDKGATRIAMYQDIDVAVRHAESFAAIQDVTT